MITIENLYSIFLKHPNISTDSRVIDKDSLFFALRGTTFEGNFFAKDALEKGAAFAIIDDEKFILDERYIIVDDVLTTLQELAKFHRDKLNIPVLGITGSNGKTTTKELVCNVLSKKFKTKATKGNLNNQIGVPLTVLSITPDIQFAIIEMGANHVGEIKFLSGICKPTYGLITNIGKAHLEGFGSIEGVIQGKTELFRFIKNNDGLIFINNDNPVLMKEAAGINQLTYGMNSEANYFGKIYGSETYFDIEWKGKIIHTQLTGNYNFENVMSAIAIGSYFGVGEAEIKLAIEDYTPTNNRSQILETTNNKLILDAYNANPSSMIAAIENFAVISGNKKIAILGDMLELGEESKMEHIFIRKEALSKGFNAVYFVGEKFNEVCLDGDVCFKSNLDALNYFKINRVNNATILLKASRGTRLEILVEVF